MFIFLYADIAMLLNCKLLFCTCDFAQRIEYIVLIHKLRIMGHLLNITRCALNLECYATIKRFFLCS